MSNERGQSQLWIPLIILIGSAIAIAADVTLNTTSSTITGNFLVPKSIEKSFQIEVWANTTIKLENRKSLVRAILSLDNGTLLENQKIDFYLNDKSIGFKLTNAEGFVDFNVSNGKIKTVFNGSSFINPSESMTEMIRQENMTFNESNINETKTSKEILSEGLEQGEAEIGKPVKWTKKIKKDLIFDIKSQIPKEAFNAKINKVNEEFIIEYYTDAPKVSEETIDESTKIVTVSSDFDYKNIKIYTNITEYKKDAIKLYLKGYSCGRGADVTNNPSVNLTFVDTNGNGLIDRLEWTADSNQTFEISIEVLNVYTYVRDGEDWIVAFNTVGTADLVINSTNAEWTELLTDIALTKDEMNFLDITCGEKSMKSSLKIIDENGVLYDYSNLTVFDSVKAKKFLMENYSCEETGYLTNNMLIAGYAALQFTFGDNVAWAYDATTFNVSCTVTGSCSGTCASGPGCPGGGEDCYAYGGSCGYSCPSRSNTNTAHTCSVTNTYSSGCGCSGGYCTGGTPSCSCSLSSGKCIYNCISGWETCDTNDTNSNGCECNVGGDTCVGTCPGTSCKWNNTYCSGSTCSYTLYNPDDDQTYCDSCIGAGKWNLGGSSSGTSCCGDDTWDKVVTCIDSSANGDCGANTQACCDETESCVNGTDTCTVTNNCQYFGGSLKSYCSSGQWEDPDELSGYCTAAGCSYSWMANVPTSGTRCCGDDTSADNSYYNSSNLQNAPSSSCERCNAGSYVSSLSYCGNGNFSSSSSSCSPADKTTATSGYCFYNDMTCTASSASNGAVSGILYGNGYLSGAGTSRTCYKSDISCSDGSYGNGASQTVYGWGHYDGSLTTSQTLRCLSGAATCSNENAANDSASTLYGNGYASGTTCYKGDIGCSSGSESNGETCALACSGVGTTCCPSQGTYNDSVACNDGSCASTIHNRDDAQSYCTATSSGCTAYNWNSTSREYESGAPSCCGDDASEVRTNRTCKTGVCTSDSSDWCCGSAQERCSDDGQCYSNNDLHDVNDDGWNEICKASSPGEWDDGAAPRYSKNSTNTTVAGYMTNFSLEWNDSIALQGGGGYIFSTNNSGTWINASWYAFSSTPQNVSNVTVLNSTVGTVVAWCYYANDSVSNWNGTNCQSNQFIITTTETTPPQWITGSNATNTIVVGVPCNFTLNWNDNYQLAGYIFSTNNSGTWVNGSYVTSFSGTSNTSWNVTTLNTTVGIKVSWCFYANDTYSNMNASSCSNPNTFIIITTSDYPKYWGNSTNSTRGGTPVNFELKWNDTDGFGLYGYILSIDNCTGSFVNQSFKLFGRPYKNQYRDNGGPVSNPEYAYDNLLNDSSTVARINSTAWILGSYINYTFKASNTSNPKLFYRWANQTVGWIGLYVPELKVLNYTSGDWKIIDNTVGDWSGNLVTESWAINSSDYISNDELIVQIFTRDYNNITISNIHLTSNTSYLNESFSNEIPVINDTQFCQMRWCYYANDTFGNMNATSCQSPFTFYTDDATPPTYSKNSTNTTVAGYMTNFSLEWNDNLWLNNTGRWIFSTNNSGTWRNYTAFSIFIPDSSINKGYNSSYSITDSSPDSATNALDNSQYIKVSASDENKLAINANSISSNNFTHYRWTFNVSKLLPGYDINAISNICYRVEGYHTGVSNSEGWIYTKNITGNWIDVNILGTVPDTNTTKCYGASYNLSRLINSTTGTFEIATSAYSFNGETVTVHINYIEINVTMNNDTRTLNFTATPQNVSYALTLNSTIGNKIAWCYYAIDNAGNWNNSCSNPFILNTTADLSFKVTLPDESVTESSESGTSTSDEEFNTTVSTIANVSPRVIPTSYYQTSLISNFRVNNTGSVNENITMCINASLSSKITLFGTLTNNPFSSPSTIPACSAGLWIANSSLPVGSMDEFWIWTNFTSAITTDSTFRELYVNATQSGT